MEKSLLEEKLAATANEIFSLPKNERNENSAQFKTLKTKLAAGIWNWCKLVFKGKMENAGVEIMECINRSFSSYNGETSYVNYISAALKKEIQRANEKEFIEENNRIKLPDKTQRELNCILRYAQSLGKDIRDKKIQRELAEKFGCSKNKIADLVLHQFRSVVQSDVPTQDGDEFSLFDFVPDRANTSAEDAIVVRTELEQRLSAIDETFRNLQERTKPYLSALITNCILCEAENANAAETAFDLLCAKSFAKTEHAQKIIERYKSGGEPFTQKEIAAWFCRDDTDASRALKNFSEKVSTSRRKNDIL